MPVRFMSLRWQTGCAGKATVFSVLLILSGCAAPPEAKIGVRLAQADLAYGPAALDHAVSEFLGPSASGGGGGSSGGSKKSGSDKKKASADIDYREIAGQEVALVVGMAQPLAEGWYLDGTLRLGQGEVDYVLPAGSLRVPLGAATVVFDEEVTLQARTRFLEAEVLAFRQFALPVPGVLELGAGGGVRRTHSRLKVSTDIFLPIEIDSRFQQTQTYGAIQARYSLPRLPLRGFAEGRYYGRDAAGIRGGGEMVLPLKARRP